jgi:hypothetical protein
VRAARAERRRNRTYPPPGYDGVPVLKTGWGTSPVPLRIQGEVYAQAAAKTGV